MRSQENKCPTLILDPDVHLPDFLLDVSIGRTNENLEGLWGLEVGYVREAFRDQPFKRPPFPGLGLEHLLGSANPGFLTFSAPATFVSSLSQPGGGVC